MNRRQIVSWEYANEYLIHDDDDDDPDEMVLPEYVNILWWLQIDIMQGIEKDGSGGEKIEGERERETI